MQDAEARALARALVILLVVSAARWGWSRTRAGEAPADTASVLPELLAESAAEADEAAARSRPLEEGERIDPNRAGDVELDRLPGVGPATARAIVEAREAGTVFARPEDLERVRGIGPATVARIRDRLDLSAPPAWAGTRRLAAAAAGVAGTGGSPRRSSPAAGAAGSALAPGPIDLNHASAAELERLPGVGPALAARIVEAREIRMFTSLEDLVRVPGIGPATVERLRGIARVGGIR